MLRVYKLNGSHWPLAINLQPTNKLLSNFSMIVIWEKSEKCTQMWEGKKFGELEQKIFQMKEKNVTSDFNTLLLSIKTWLKYIALTSTLWVDKTIITESGLWPSWWNLNMMWWLLVTQSVRKKRERKKSHGMRIQTGCKKLLVFFLYLSCIWGAQSAIIYCCFVPAKWMMLFNNAFRVFFWLRQIVCCFLSMSK